MKRLDYQLQTETMEKQYQHKHLVAWLEESVRQTLQSKPVSGGGDGERRGEGEEAEDGHGCRCDVSWIGA